MRQLIRVLAAAVIMIGPQTSAVGQTSLAVSPATQTVEDYGREWRRARKMARACGATQSYMSFVSFSEGMLVAAKADQQRKLGKKVEEDSSQYVLGFADDFDANAQACARHQAAFAPILDAISKAFDEKSGVVLYLPPTVPCPSQRSC